MVAGFDPFSTLERLIVVRALLDGCALLSRGSARAWDGPLARGQVAVITTIFSSTTMHRHTSSSWPEVR
jgi:hypothetical protein